MKRRQKQDLQKLKPHGETRKRKNKPLKTISYNIQNCQKHAWGIFTTILSQASGWFQNVDTILGTLTNLNSEQLNEKQFWRELTTMQQNLSPH